MSEHVNLRSVIAFLEQCGHAMKYDDFRRTFEIKIENELYYIGILNSTLKYVGKEVGVYSGELSIDLKRGYQTGQKCAKCT